MEMNSIVGTFSIDRCFQGAFFLICKTSKKLILLFISNSNVNLMFLWKVLSIIKTWFIDANFIVAIVSSTYRFHGVMYSIDLGSSVLSNLTINIPVIISLSGDYIATPLHCWYISLLNKRCTFFVHERNSSFIFNHLMLVCISFSL